MSTANASVSTSQNSTSNTGTSTGPQPVTTESGTQSGEARTQQATGTHHDEGLEAEMQRIQQQMSAGLQSVLGQVRGRNSIIRLYTCQTLHD